MKHATSATKKSIFNVSVELRKPFHLIKKQKDGPESEDDSNHMQDGIFHMKTEECIMTTILVYDTKKRTWVQRKITDKMLDKLSVTISLCHESYESLSGKKKSTRCSEIKTPYQLGLQIRDVYCYVLTSLKS